MQYGPWYGCISFNVYFVIYANCYSCDDLMQCSLVQSLHSGYNCPFYRYLQCIWTAESVMWLWYLPVLIWQKLPEQDTIACMCTMQYYAAETVVNIVLYIFNYLFQYIYAFNALTLLDGHQEEHPTCKNWLMRCWCGYLSGVRCRLFAYGPADATAIPKPHHLLPHLNPDWFYLSGTGLPRLLSLIHIWRCRRRG